MFSPLSENKQKTLEIQRVSRLGRKARVFVSVELQADARHESFQFILEQDQTKRRRETALMFYRPRRPLATFKVHTGVS